MKVAIIIGTTREQRKSIHVGKLVEKIAREIDEFEPILVDPKDFNLSGDGNDPEGRDPRYTEITKDAEAFVIVTPEYNHGYPGSLKRLLDMEYDNYFRKPVFLVGVSSGITGGARAVELLIPVVAELGLIFVRAKIYVGRVQEVFNEQGEYIDDGQLVEKIKKAFDDLLWMAKALK